MSRKIAVAEAVAVLIGRSQDNTALAFAQAAQLLPATELSPELVPLLVKLSERLRSARRTEASDLLLFAAQLDPPRRPELFDRVIENILVIDAEAPALRMLELDREGALEALHRLVASAEKGDQARLHVHSRRLLSARAVGLFGAAAREFAPWLRKLLQLEKLDWPIGTKALRALPLIGATTLEDATAAFIWLEHISQLGIPRSVLVDAIEAFGQLGVHEPLRARFAAMRHRYIESNSSKSSRQNSVITALNRLY